MSKNRIWAYYGWILIVALRPKRPMARKVYRPVTDPQAAEKMAEFRDSISHEVDHAIEGHESKMIYIGFATLAIFAAVLYGAWKIQIF